MVIVLIPIAEECPRRGQFDWNIIRVAAGMVPQRIQDHPRVPGLFCGVVSNWLRSTLAVEGLTDVDDMMRWRPGGHYCDLYLIKSTTVIRHAGHVQVPWWSWL
jgi:hypothetical protein